MSSFRQLVGQALKEDDFGKKLRNPGTRKKALVDFGLEGDDLQKALDALNKVDMEAIEGFRDALDGPVEIPI